MKHLETLPSSHNKQESASRGGEGVTAFQTKTDAWNHMVSHMPHSSAGWRDDGTGSRWGPTEGLLLHSKKTDAVDN